MPSDALISLPSSANLFNWLVNFVFISTEPTSFTLSTTSFESLLKARITADSDPQLYGEQDDPILLAYHRFYSTSGAHFNSIELK